MGVRGTRWLLVAIAMAGLVLVLAAFGALHLGIGTSAADLCVDARDSVRDEGPVYKAARLWLPLVGWNCTYAPAHDVHVQRSVFDWPASIVAIAGWALLTTSAVWAARSARRR